MGQGRPAAAAACADVNLLINNAGISLSRLGEIGIDVRVAALHPGGFAGSGAAVRRHSGVGIWQTAGGCGAARRWRHLQPKPRDTPLAQRGMALGARPGELMRLFRRDGFTAVARGRRLWAGGRCDTDAVDGQAPV
jgi:hypothetical protein